MKEESSEQARLVKLWTQVITRLLLLLAGAALILWLLYKLSAIILMMVLSIFFCYLIAPVVRLFEQPVYIAGRELKLSRGVAIFTVYILIGAVLFTGLRLVVPLLREQITELGKNLPVYLSTGSTGISKTINDANSWMRHLNLPQEWRESILSRISQAAEGLFPWLQSLLVGALGYLVYLPWLILIPIVSFFFLKDAAMFERGLVALMPTEKLQKRAHWLLLDVSRTLAAYIRAQLTACLVIGMLVTIGLALIGVPYALVLGLIAGVLEFVPMIGPLLSAIIAFSLTLTTSFKMALIVAVFLAVLRIVQDYIIYPRIVGHGIKMHPLLVVIAILGGAEIGGLSGVFLAIPIVGLFIVGYNHYLAYKGIENARKSAPDEQALPNLESELSASGSNAPALEN